jgi:hypothetical protein
MHLIPGTRPGRNRGLEAADPVDLGYRLRAAGAIGELEVHEDIKPRGIRVVVGSRSLDHSAWA